MKNEKAVITIEAAIVMPIFIMVILFIISIIRLVYIHDIVQHSINDMAVIMSGNKQELKEVNTQSEQFLKSILREKVTFNNNSNLLNKIQNINFENSKIDQNNIDIIIDYEVKSMFEFFPNYSITQRCAITSEGITSDKTNEYIWGKDHIVRGLEIQSIFGKNVSKNANGKFFKFDVNGNEAIEMRTLDPTLKSYQRTGAIVATVKEDIIKFAKAGEQYKIKSRKFVLVIPKNTNNEFIAAELDKLSKIASENGMKFEVVEFGVKS